MSASGGVTFHPRGLLASRSSWNFCAFSALLLSGPRLATYGALSLARAPTDP